jgi:hypothetical protein
MVASDLDEHWDEYVSNRNDDVNVPHSLPKNYSRAAIGLARNSHLPRERAVPTKLSGTVNETYFSGLNDVGFSPGYILNTLLINRVRLLRISLESMDLAQTTKARAITY